MDDLRGHWIGLIGIGAYGLKSEKFESFGHKGVSLSSG